MTLEFDFNGTCPKPMDVRRHGVLRASVLRAAALLAASVLAAVLAATLPAQAQIRSTGDDGREVVLAQPARRIIALSPHAAELLFAAGAGNAVVGAVEYSDYPEAAKRIPRVGNHQRLDLERIARLKPDLIVAWRHGGARQIAQLRALGMPLYLNEPARLEDIAATIDTLGRLAGTGAVARDAAEAFRTRLAALRQQHAGAAPVRTLLQIWHQPVMTVNGKHLMSHALQVCGGVNVFAALPALAPAIDVEAVLGANPALIVTASADDEGRAWLAEWQKWPHLAASASGQLRNVAPDLLTRHTPRILDGIERLCAHLDTARLAARTPLTPAPSR